jgi:FtsZ-binding cell division protein ZapB
MGKELTDEEIVKAFENCKNLESCCFCKLWKEVSNDNNCNDLALDLIHRLQAEIERLTEENGQLKGYNSGLEYENAELQKQVDELKKRLIDEFEKFKVEAYQKLKKQAVKDTAKEILQELSDFVDFETFREGYELTKVKRKIKEMAKYKGVEVE